MLRTFAVMLALPLAALLVACETSSDPADPGDGGDEDAPLVVDPSGGTITAHDGRVTLEVPADALASETEITVDEVADPPADPDLVPTTSFDFGPDGLTFEKPVTMELAYPEADLPEGASEARLRIHKLEGSEWRSVSGSVDPDGDRARARVTGFSVYGVRMDPCATAPISIDTSLTGRLDGDDCAVEDADGERFEEAFALTREGTGAFAVSLESTGFVPGVGLRAAADAAEGPGTLWARSEPSEGTSARFTVLAGGGDYRLYAASRDGGDGDFELTLTATSSSNSLGCSQGMFIAPGVSGVEQTIDAGRDCVVTIKFPATPEVDQKETVEEYYWIRVPGGETVTVTTSRTGGDDDFTPFPTLFLGEGEVVQTEGDPVAPSKTISHTAQATRFILLGVSATLDENLDYTEGSYTLSVEVR